MHSLDMGPESQIGNMVEKISLSLRVSTTRNMSITVLLAVCGTAQLIPIKHPVPLDKNIHEAPRLQYPLVNPEVKHQGQTIHWLLESQSVIVLERA